MAEGVCPWSLLNPVRRLRSYLPQKAKWTRKAHEAAVKAAAAK